MADNELHAVSDKFVGDGHALRRIEGVVTHCKQDFLAVDATGSIDFSGCGLGALLNLNPIGTIIATEGRS